MRVVLLAVWLWLAALAVARADGECDAPLADWQPREALVAKLQTEGWQNIAIRIEDGCYLVRAFKTDGGRLRGKFDPATLAPLPGGHGRHGGDGSDHPHPED